MLFFGGGERNPFKNYTVNKRYRNKRMRQTKEEQINVPESKRALRRHHTDRLKRRTKKLLSRWGIYSEEKAVNTSYNNITRCSCCMCCNPRHGIDRSVTRQEKEADLNFKEWREELADF
jgi:hypothetical protein